MDATVRVRSLVMFAGAVFAGMVATLVVMWAMRVDAAPGDTDTTFVPITACRLVDTRPPSNQVGPRNTPLGANETYTVDVQDASTECAGQIPAAATGLSLNVTAAQTSTGTFLTIWDQGPWPGTSSLNPVPGPPAPNAVTTKLSAGDTFEIYNDAGTTHVIVDIGGYYTDASLDELDSRLNALETAGVDVDVLDRLEALETKVTALETQNATQASEITALETQNTTQASKITTLETKTASISLETVDGQPTVRFSNVNVQIVSASGSTAGTVNGRGNLIVGYNENIGDQRTGSHNLIVGPYHSYISFGGFVTGFDNTINGSGASVSGGYLNTASGIYASVSGGVSNTASGYGASVSGGAFNSASDEGASVSGGYANSATGILETVAGGDGVTCNNNSPSFQAVVCGEGTWNAID